MIQEMICSIQLETLMKLDVDSYTVDLVGGFMLYRPADGWIRVHKFRSYYEKRMHASRLDKELLTRIYTDSIRGKISGEQLWTELVDLGVATIM